MHIGNSFTKYAVKDKRHRSVNGSILLPLALRYRLLCLGACGIFVALAMPSIKAPTVFADTASDAVTVSFPSTPFTLDTTPSATGHQSEEPASITVSGQGSWGYTFSITSDSASNDLTSDGHTLPSISTEKDTVADFDDNTWGFKITGGTTKSTKFRPGPTKEASAEIDATEEAIKPTIYQLTLGAKVDGTQPAGTYSGQVTIMITANVVHYGLSYLPNTGDADTDSTIDMPTPVDDVSAKNKVTEQLSNMIPEWDGYKFKGWCDIKPVSPTAECTGETYNPNGSITWDLQKEYSSNNKQLFAMWEKESNEPPECQHLTQVGQTGELVDKRGGQTETYKIRRLADDRCWMVENLRLGGDKEIILTPDDSNVLENFTLPAGSTTVSFDDPKINITYKDTVVENNNNGQKYGVYYNWIAASAGAKVIDGSSYGYVGQSVCPKGWRLPSADEFSNLFEAYNRDCDKMLDTSGPEFVLSGYAYRSQLNLAGTEGRFWTSRGSSAGGTTASGATITTSRFNAAGGTYATNYTLSVRCVAEQ